jgi:hypothetical protein
MMMDGSELKRFTRVPLCEVVVRVQWWKDIC